MDSFNDDMCYWSFESSSLLLPLMDSLPLLNFESREPQSSIATDGQILEFESISAEKVFATGS